MNVLFAFSPDHKDIELSFSFFFFQSQCQKQRVTFIVNHAQVSFKCKKEIKHSLVYCITENFQWFKYIIQEKKAINTVRFH